MSHRPAEVVARLCSERRTVATAESLTGGLVCAALTGVPGASVVVRGGIIAYAAEVKVALLGVPEATLADFGTVSAQTARAMAEGARQLLGADWAVATTGVAGPDPSEGQPVGTVHVAVSGARGDGEEIGTARSLCLHGSRAEIRDEAVRQAVDLLHKALGR